MVLGRIDYIRCPLDYWKDYGVVVMREKLIKLLKESTANCDPGGNCLTCQYRTKADCMERITADYMISNGVTVQEWISVKDRLPEDICPVLVALEGLNIAFHGFYQDEKWWKVGAGTRPFTQKVTHWMLLPQPPKGECP